MNKIRTVFRIKAFAAAFNGVFVAFRHETHLQLHAMAMVVVVLLGVYASLNTLEWGLILLCIALVMGAELINTAIETYIDYNSPERHPEIGKAKDIAAAAVLVCALFATTIGCIIFIPKFL